MIHFKLNNFGSLIAQVVPVTEDKSGLMNILFFALMFGGLWFLMIAPQRKKQKQQAAMMEALQAGDEVITTSGIYATIHQVREDRFILKIADNTKIEIVKGAVQAIPAKKA